MECLFSSHNKPFYNVTTSVNCKKMCGALAVFFFILTLKQHQHNFSKYDTCETQTINLIPAKSLAGDETPQ
jgi:hypothetical protein